MNSTFLNHLKSPKRPVLVFDGATGTSLQSQNLTAEDFGGPEYEGCNEYLVHTKPSAVEQVHQGFLEAGADVIETDTFGGTSIVLAEYDLADQAYYLTLIPSEMLTLSKQKGYTMGVQIYSSLKLVRMYCK